MAPKHKNRDAGNLDMPQRSCIVLLTKNTSTVYTVLEDILREGHHIHITVYYNCSILLLTVNLLLCLIYKLNVIMGVYV